MSVSQNFGVLRVVRVGPVGSDSAAATALKSHQEKFPRGWLPEERLVHLLTRRETTIGRGLGNDLILIDPTVSREHARLAFDEQGWRVYNVTTQNTVHVNGCAVPSGESLAMQSQDFLTLGSVVLQLIAPNIEIAHEPPAPESLWEGFPLLNPVSDAAPDPPGNGHRRDEENEHAHPNEKALAPEKAHGASRAAHPSTTELALQSWYAGAENLLGAGVTMQFSLAQRLGSRTRWFIVSVGITFLVISALVTIVLSSLGGFSALAHYGTLNVLAVLTTPLIPVLGISLLVNFIDRFEREPWFLRLAAFLWGAIIAIPPALFIEQYVDMLITSRLGSGASLVLFSLLQGLKAGVTEETIKGVGLLLLFIVLRDEFDNVTDGIVYGALIGAGFAMVENFFYFVSYPRDLLSLFVARIVLGWLYHSTFTVCFGVALGYIRHTKVRWQHIFIPLLGYLAAVGLHTVFDFINVFAKEMVIAYHGNATVTTYSTMAAIGNYIPPFLAQVVILYFLIKSLAHEGAVIREFLAPEVVNGVVTVEEYALVQHSVTRIRAERCVLRSRGLKQYIRVKALYQTEIGLAFRKWHVSMGDKPKLGYVQPEDAYRERIKRLRQEIVQGEKKQAVRRR